MVRKTSSPKSKTRKPKTFVYPYEALQPIVSVDKNGVPQVREFDENVGQRVREVRNDFEPILEQLRRDTLRPADLENLREQFETFVGGRLREATRDLSTKVEFDLLRATLEEMRNNLEQINTSRGSSERVVDRIRQLIDASQEEMKTRLDNLEQEILRRIESINERISDARQTLAATSESQQMGNVKEIIDELQRMEAELLRTLGNVRELISQEVIKRSELTTLKITDFLIELDNMKSEIRQIVRKSEADILNEIRLVRNAYLEDLKEEGAGIKELLQTRIDSLSNSTRSEIVGLREEMERLLSSTPSKEGLSTLMESQERILNELIGELKNDTRNQIDRIIESMQPIRTGLDEEVERLKDEINEKNKTIVDLERLRDESSQDKLSISADLERLREEVREKNQSIADLEALKEEHRRQVAQLRTDSEIKDKRIEELEGDIKKQREQILALEQEIEAKRLSSVDKSVIEELERERDLKQEIIDKRTAELTREIENYQARLKNATLANENTQRELARVQSELRAVTSNLEEGMRQLSKLEGVQDDYNRTLEEFKDKKKQLERIGEEVVDILKSNGQEAMDSENVSFNLSSLSSMIESKNEELKEKKKPCPKTPIVKAPIPRYAVLRSGNYIDLIDLNKKVVDFTATNARLLKNDLYDYTMQILGTNESIRRLVYDNDYIFHVRGQIIKNLRPSNISELFSEYDITPSVVEDENFDPKDKKIVGRFVLTDVFSPGIDPNITSNTNLVVASGISKVFSYKDAIDLAVNPFESFISRSQLVQNLRRIFQSVGHEIVGEDKILYDVQEMFSVQMFLIDDLKEYINTTTALGKFSEETIYNIEIRMILLDAFMKAFLEMKTSLESMTNFYGSRNYSVPSPVKQKLISYVRIRADNNSVDPRFSILLNSKTPEAARRSKLQVSHSPYVLSSLSMNDVDTPYYQHDVYGPFTRVFLPDESNREVANNVDEILNALNSNKDVCTLSLGPSGSGKTSTLLYFRGTDTVLPSKGVIPLIMDKLDGRFTKVTVSGVEFSANYKSDKGKKYWQEHEVFEETVNFLRSESDNDWRSEKANLSINTFSYTSTNDVCEQEVPFEKLSRTKTSFGEGQLSIGDFLSKLIDIRLNCGTPMNPVSSRTHLFLFLKFVDKSNKENSPTLIVADLAGREKAFDCGSEGILEIFSLNNYYPTLNKLINNPLASAADPPRFEVVAGEKFPADKIHGNIMKAGSESKEIIEDTLTSFKNYSLKKLFLILRLDKFFEYVDTNKINNGDGFVKNGLDISSEYYNFLSRVLTYVVNEAKLTEAFEKRLINIDSQPKDLRDIMGDISPSLANTMNQILAYFISPSGLFRGNNVPSGVAQFKKMKLNLRGVTETDLSNGLRMMRRYLEALMIISYLSAVLNDKPADVCRYRNVEGEFINRSLDEFSNLIMLAASSDGNGPMIHAECLPLTCSFAGMDCLLPKNVPKDFTESAISKILKRGMGKTTLEMDKMVFCVFVVLNMTRRPSSDKIFRPLFDSAEPLMREITEAFNKFKLDLEFHDRPETSSSSSAFPTRLLDEFKNTYQTFMDVYRAETELVDRYRSRLEYRGIDPKRMLTEDFKDEVYRLSVSHWKMMMSTRNVMLNILTDRELKNAKPQVVLEFDNIVRKIREFVEYLQIKNQDTSLGVLNFADDLVKFGLQPMSCTGFDSRETVLKSTVGWTNVQYKI